jgi:5-methylcytosine-specific restriction endonuclease McrA
MPVFYLPKDHSEENPNKTFGGHVTKECEKKIVVDHFNNNIPYHELSSKYGFDIRTIKRICLYVPDSYLNDKKLCKNIIDSYNNGNSVNKICETLNVTHVYVAAYLERLGLKRNRSQTLLVTNGHKNYQTATPKEILTDTRKISKKISSSKAWKTSVQRKYIQQNGKCAVCGKLMRDGDYQGHHIKKVVDICNEARVTTPEDAMKLEQIFDLDNIMVVHAACHRKIEPKKGRVIFSVNEELKEKEDTIEQLQETVEILKEALINKNTKME